MEFIAQIIFISVFSIATYFAIKKFASVRKNIFLGRKEKINGNRKERWKNVILLALGQKKMFRNFIPAFFHLFIYVSFVIVNIELIEIVIDGIAGTHRFFAPYLGSFYTFLISFIEVLSAAAFISTIIFLVRRNILKIKRFTQPELKGWPFKDANFILYMELILVTAILVMNASDFQLQLRNTVHYPDTGNIFIAQYASSIFTNIGTDNLIMIERSAWWIHIIGILFFLNYIPYSKHLHIILAFPNAYYKSLAQAGKMENMSVVMNEVKSILDSNAALENIENPPKSFGAKDVTDLSWKQLLDAFSCTECGRCTDACPANQTGKKLSPRKIMMDTRDRAEELGRLKDKSGKDFIDNKSLLGDYISIEEIRACTSCNACVEECPVSINPLSIILDLRRYAIMEQSDAPSSWNTMFNSLENNQAPWQFNPMDRANWIDEIKA